MWLVEEQIILLTGISSIMAALALLSRRRCGIFEIGGAAFWNSLMKGSLVGSHGWSHEGCTLGPFANGLPQLVPSGLSFGKSLSERNDGALPGGKRA